MEAEVENEIEAYIDGEIHEIPFATKKRDWTSKKTMQPEEIIISDI